MIIRRIYQVVLTYAFLVGGIGILLEGKLYGLAFVFIGLFMLVGMAHGFLIWRARRRSTRMQETSGAKPARPTPAISRQRRSD
jgi:bacteriorhodopsin